ncbi:MAG: sigma-70 family RNA polymerase sigma factor [Gemmatimonadota bacterium]|nr:MAG: sigma-70 family RNA polymerase sigma factor [Gemmatimonadota bacterium]
MHGIGRDPATDQQLVDALREGGSEAAFRELYRRHTPRLLQFVTRVLGGLVEDAEDVVQETWVKAVGGLSRFRGEASLGTWLTGIGLNTARMHLRRLGRWRGFLEAMEPESGPPALSHEERMDLECVLAYLPDGQRLVLLLHDLEGYTHGEIGELLGIAEGTSKSQLSAARKRAQALYDGGVPRAG